MFRMLDVGLLALGTVYLASRFSGAQTTTTRSLDDLKAQIRRAHSEYLPHDGDVTFLVCETDEMQKDGSSPEILYRSSESTVRFLRDTFTTVLNKSRFCNIVPGGARDSSDDVLLVYSDGVRVQYTGPKWPDSCTYDVEVSDSPAGVREYENFFLGHIGSDLLTADGWDVTVGENGQIQLTWSSSTEQRTAFLSEELGFVVTRTSLRRTTENKTTIIDVNTSDYFQFEDKWIPCLSESRTEMKDKSGRVTRLVHKSLVLTSAKRLGSSPVPRVTDRLLGSGSTVADRRSSIVGRFGRVTASVTSPFLVSADEAVADELLRRNRLMGRVSTGDPSRFVTYFGAALGLAIAIVAAHYIKKRYSARLHPLNERN